MKMLKDYKSNVGMCSSIKRTLHTRSGTQFDAKAMMKDAKKAEMELKSDMKGISQAKMTRQRVTARTQIRKVFEASEKAITTHAKQDKV